MPVRFTTPPSWPPAPAGFIPERGWEPDPFWPAPPPGWSFYTDGGSPITAPVGAWQPPELAPPSARPDHRNDPRLAPPGPPIAAGYPAIPTADQRAHAVPDPSPAVWAAGPSGGPARLSADFARPMPAGSSPNAVPEVLPVGKQGPSSQAPTPATGTEPSQRSARVRPAVTAIVLTTVALILAVVLAAFFLLRAPGPKLTSEEFTGLFPIGSPLLGGEVAYREAPLGRLDWSTPCPVAIERFLTGGEETGVAWNEAQDFVALVRFSTATEASTGLKAAANACNATAADADGATWILDDSASDDRVIVAYGNVGAVAGRASGRLDDPRSAVLEIRQEIQDAAR